jgi:hypothetical protein
VFIQWGKKDKFLQPVNKILPAVDRLKSASIKHDNREEYTTPCMPCHALVSD